jgi:hypothetical protein
MDPLLANLRPIRRRLRLVRALEVALVAALLAAAVAAILSVLRLVLPDLIPWASDYPAAPLLLVPLAFIAAFLVCLLLGVSFRRTAAAADRAAGLQERLATAVEVLEHSPPGFVRTDFAQAEPGLLDAHLIDQAREAAARLHPARLRLAGPLTSRRVRWLLVATVVLAAVALVPARTGPPVSPQAAARAADALDRFAQDDSLTPPLRAAVETAVARLRLAAGIRQRAADRATDAVRRAVSDAEAARRRVLDRLAAVADPDLQALARAAGRPAAAGSSAILADLAAESLADRLRQSSGDHAVTPADRRRLADGLAGAAPIARRAGFADLADALKTAADAVRATAPLPTDRTNPDVALAQLASVAVASLAEPPPDRIEGLFEALDEARRALGLPAGTAPAAPGLPRRRPGEPGSAAAPSATPSAPTALGASPSAAPSSDEQVRPEDRPAVRRYFSD